MKAPCETILWYVLPAIRAELARDLLDLGLTQKDVSDRLGLTQASVSYYAGKKRGTSIKFKKNIKKDIKKLAQNIKDGGLGLGEWRVRYKKKPPMLKLF